MMEHFRKFAILYVFAGWTVVCMFTFGGRATGSGTEYARVLR